MPWWVTRHVAAPPPYLHLPSPRATHVVGAQEVPAVDPVATQDLTPDDARAANAAVPFDTGPNPAARPFRFAGNDAARARATDCLTAALIYEAGDDTQGQRAVAQVVLNRLRHPAFPKTVCGVVFQGQERSTGCQFTFTCDGALTRWRPTAPQWDRAAAIARGALSGSVYRPVGYATHYHTDWVVPYWRDSLDKIARVSTHLFYRWTGWWGTPGAFRRTVSGDEPTVAKLAALSATHRMGAALDEAATAVAAAAPLVEPPGTTPAMGATVAATPAQPGDTFTVALNAAAPDGYPAQALAACGARSHCKFMGWTDARALPASTVMSPAQIAAMSFSYLRDRDAGLERTLWNCDQFRGRDPTRCMKRQMTLSARPVAPIASPSPVAATPAEPPALTGVRRKAQTATPPSAQPD